MKQVLIFVDVDVWLYMFQTLPPPVIPDVPPPTAATTTTLDSLIEMDEEEEEEARLEEEPAADVGVDIRQVGGSQYCLTSPIRVEGMSVPKIFLMFAHVKFQCWLVSWSNVITSQRPGSLLLLSVTSLPDPDRDWPSVMIMQEYGVTSHSPLSPQAYEDLLAPPTATYEDLVKVEGTQKELQDRQIPTPFTGPRLPVYSTSVSFLSSWAPTTERKYMPTSEVEDEGGKKSIHHFCKMTSEFQLPKHFQNVGRKYHTPDQFSSSFPAQPYRVS